MIEKKNILLIVVLYTNKRYILFNNLEEYMFIMKTKGLWVGLDRVMGFFRTN